MRQRLPISVLGDILFVPTEENGIFSAWKIISAASRILSDSAVVCQIPLRKICLKFISVNTGLNSAELKIGRLRFLIMQTVKQWWQLLTVTAQM